VFSKDIDVERDFHPMSKSKSMSWGNPVAALSDLDKLTAQPYLKCDQLI
jgi:hypothetical protein